LFDITSGVLRQAWKFDGSDRVPDDELVQAALRHVGWQRVLWQSGQLTLEAGMEIDFGGIGKEYAVDRAAGLVAAEFDASCLINFGGDLVITHPRTDGLPWRVGIEDSQSEGATATRMINLTAGALATSGDAKRFLLKDGVRYCHILDPTTGWPVRDSPHAVTVAAGSCLEAGMLATLAMLKGAGAEAFLKKEKARCWVQRGD
jgi:thiamine biosynthesis lipoprotein